MKKIILTLFILLSATLSVHAGTLEDIGGVLNFDSVPICLADGSVDFYNENLNEIIYFDGNRTVNSRINLNQYGSGDISQSFMLNRVTQYSFGMDRSDNKLKFDTSSSLGLDDIFAMDLDENFEIDSTYYLKNVDSTKLQATIDSCTNGCTIYIQDETFTLDSVINLSSNIKIIGINSPSITLGDDFYFKTNDASIENFEFSGFTMDATFSDQKSNSLFELNGLDYIYNVKFSDLQVSDYRLLSDQDFIIELETANGVLANVLIDNLVIINSSAGVNVEENTFDYNLVRNININNIYFSQGGNNATFWSEFGYVVFIRGAQNVNIENVYSHKFSDHPTVVLRRVRNGNIHNIETLEQHDYPLEITDGCRNIDVTGLNARDPQRWGIFYLNNKNFVDANENIKLSGLYCENCATYSTSQPAIWLRQDYANAQPMKNIEISNFYINNSAGTGAITVEAEDGGFDNIRILNGRIENTDNAGIRFVDKEGIKNVLIENVNFLNNGINPIDNNKRSGIFFDYANVSNAIVRSNTFDTDDASTLYYFKENADTATPGSYLEVQAMNNQINGLSLSRFDDRVYDIDDQRIYTSAPSGCGSVDFFTGKSIFVDDGTDKFCLCQQSSWKCSTLT